MKIGDKVLVEYTGDGCPSDIEGILRHIPSATGDCYIVIDECHEYHINPSCSALVWVRTNLKEEHKANE